MQFLKQHIEKIVLGLTLVGLLGSILSLLHSLNRTVSTGADLVAEARSAATGGRPLALIDPGEFPDVHRVIADPKVRLDTLPSSGAGPLRGSLYEPPDYILCYSDDCHKLIPIGTNRCPFCRTEQPPRRGVEADPGDDIDGDGIPNFVERKYTFLNPQNPYDALQDQDGDGFLNVEEYRLATDMQDPASHPPLGHLLRFDRVDQKPLPVRLKRITRNNSDNPSDWSLQVEFFVRQRWSTKLLRLGAQNEGFTIRAARFEDNPAQPGKTIGAIEVVPPDGSEAYVLREGETVNERQQAAGMFFMLSRYAQHVRAGGLRRLSHQVGEEFVLTRGRAPNVVSETYRVEAISAQGVEVIRIAPPAAEGEAPIRISVPRIDPRKDFIPQMPGGMGMGMGYDETMPAEPGMPGPGTSPGGRMRPMMP